MKTDKKMKLVVNNEVATKKNKTVNSTSRMSNPIYGRYLEFTSKKTKKKISIREFLNELF